MPADITLLRSGTSLLLSSRVGNRPAYAIARKSATIDALVEHQGSTDQVKQFRLGKAIEKRIGGGISADTGISIHNSG